MSARDHKYGTSLGLGEFDELWSSEASVHIERMDKRAFWMGIYLPDKRSVMVNTGVTHSGIWFFNVDENWHEGRRYEIQVPRRPRIDETSIQKCLGLRDQIDRLRARIAELEKENAELEKQNASLKSGWGGWRP